MAPGFNLIVDSILPAGGPPPPRPESRRSISVPRSASIERNKKRNSILVNDVIKRSSTLRRNSSLMTNRDASKAVKSGGFGRGNTVSRWDGIKQSQSDWDSIRRDPELWYPGGNALIHLYAQGHSRRGPSMRVPFEDIEQSNCVLLLNDALAHVPQSTPTRDSGSQDGGFASNPRGDDKYELYIPAPALLDREQALKYHITTRNFFAWMFDKPLVGAKLGEALISLHERMNLFRPDREQNQDDMLAYIENQGYSDFRNCADHALGILQYAEKYELTELWTDAFVHCAGMNESLVSSRDFAGVSRTTKALITRANLEMSVRLERTSMSLANFMEDDLGFLKLQEPMVKHIERFRSFLHSYYVQKHGYWPPNSPQKSERGRQGRAGPLAKSTLLTMYADFRNLYELLADLEAPERSSSEKAKEGLDMAQVTAKFDRRQKFTQLPYVLPLLPANVPEVAESRFSSFLPSFIRRAKGQHRTNTLAALHTATNVSAEPAVMNSPLVIEYFRFEREYTLNEDERLPAAEARKARWLLVYVILQTLADVTKAPVEVRDTEGVDYPLCCQTAGTPPWAPTSRPTVAITETRSTIVPPRRSSSQASHRSSATDHSLHSAVPSARVDPLDLELVASKRMSVAQPPPAIAAPQPRHAADQETALRACYDAVLSEEPDDLPGLSPTLPREGTEDGHRQSSEEGSSASEADTPTSSKFADAGLGIMSRNGDEAVKAGLVPPAPPSPSIYDEDVHSASKSEFNLLLSGNHRRLTSDELARRWQGEIGAL